MLAFTISGFCVSTSAIQLEPIICMSHARAWVIQVVLKLGASNSTLMLPLSSLVSIGCHRAVFTSFSRRVTLSKFFSLTSTDPDAMAISTTASSLRARVTVRSSEPFSSTILPYAISLSMSSSWTTPTLFGAAPNVVFFINMCPRP